MNAFGSFRDVLAADMASALPELRTDVRRVCEATGGTVPPGLASGPEAAATTTATTMTGGSAGGDAEMGAGGSAVGGVASSQETSLAGSAARLGA